jgi:tripartite-type tricarboxylate transporter receptor subunit TctC
MNASVSGRVLALSAIVGVAGLAAEAMPASAQSAVANFYRGKTINVLIGTVVGGEYDLHTRLVARFMGKHIPGNPNIVPQNMAGGGGIMMANYIYTVPPKDGTFLGVMNNGYPLAQAMKDPTVKFDTSKFHWLGTIAPTSETLTVWHTTGVKTLEDARQKEVVIGATGKGSIIYTFPKLMNELLGTKFKIVLGYRGGNDVNGAMERGEVGGRDNTWSSWKSTKPHWLANKQIYIIAQGGITAKDLPGVPNVEDVAKSDDDRRIFRLFTTGSKLGRPLVTTPGVPADRVEALRKAFLDTMKDSEFLAAAAKAKVEVDPISGVELQKMVAEMLDTPQPLLERAKKLVE